MLVDVSVNIYFRKEAIYTKYINIQSVDWKTSDYTIIQIPFLRWNTSR
jgi:hypothetical protein